MHYRNSHSQIFQNPLIKEYTLVYTKDHDFELGYIPEIRGFGRSGFLVRHYE